MKRLAGKPFALLGVNSDRDRDKLKDVMTEKNISWRSFWNGGSTSGPISTRWNVRGWPTMYLLDDKGVIRHKFVGSPGGKALDEHINAILKEMGVEVEEEYSKEEPEPEKEKAKEKKAKDDDK